MQCVRKLTDDVYYVGGNDRKTPLFENHYPINGVSYNSYLVKDEKTVLLDCTDVSIHDMFFENLSYALDGRRLDYLIVNHMEPDHCGVMASLILRYPEVKIVSNAKAIAMIKQFFDFDTDDRCVLVNDGDELCSGKHTFRFLTAPMVHWPEVMTTYDLTDKTLYSADAFGSFGAIEGALIADRADFEAVGLREARRYYANIVGKYGAQVQALLKKLSGVQISTLCPLHGQVWRGDIDWYVGKYQEWSTYTPEESAVMIVFGSVYGHTENAADILAAKLDSLGVKNIKIYDVSKIHSSYIVAEAFRCSHIVFAAATYNSSVFTAMESVLHELSARNLQNRTVGIIENGSWAPAAGRLMEELLQSMKGMTVLEPTVSVRSALKPKQAEQLEELALTVADSVNGRD